MFYLDKKNCIVGLQATYIKHHEVLNGFKNIMEITLQTAELSEVVFEISDDDFIRNVYGLYSDWIEYLRFETEKGRIFEVGTVNQKENSKEFSLKIRNFDIPVTLFGALDLKKGQFTVYLEFYSLIFLFLHNFFVKSLEFFNFRRKFQ